LQELTRLTGLGRLNVLQLHCDPRTLIRELLLDQFLVVLAFGVEKVVEEPNAFIMLIALAVHRIGHVHGGHDFKDEADTLSTKMAPSFDCACLATLHALGGGASLAQLAKTDALTTLVKTNTTAMTKKGKVIHGKCVCN